MGPSSHKNIDSNKIFWLMICSKKVRIPSWVRVHSLTELCKMSLPSFATQRWCLKSFPCLKKFDGLSPQHQSIIQLCMKHKHIYPWAYQKIKYNLGRVLFLMPKSHVGKKKPTCWFLDMTSQSFKSNFVNSSINTSWRTFQAFSVKLVFLVHMRHDSEHASI